MQVFIHVNQGTRFLLDQILFRLFYYGYGFRACSGILFGGDSMGARWCWGALLSLLLVACGGGGSDSSSPAPNDNPPSSGNTNGGTDGSSGEGDSGSPPPPSQGEGGSDSGDGNPPEYTVDPSARFDSPSDLALGSTGELFVLDAGNNLIKRISPTGDVATIPATFGETAVEDIAPAPQGDVYAKVGYEIRRLTPEGESTVVSAILTSLRMATTT
jgi:hypothetical protein